MLKTCLLKNNIKLIYSKTVSPLSSICIGLEAGAAVEDKCFGIAHLTEHMLYKGTKNRSEADINQLLSDIFAFQNAMTNYPYVIYYGTMLEQDFSKGVELFSDIIINPSFELNGFSEEKNVVIQELSEWDEEIEQYCEDRLFYNAFDNRLKYPIIGTKEAINKITIQDIKNFYDQYYYAENTTITVVSSLEFEQVKVCVEEYFNCMKNNHKIQINDSSEIKRSEVFVDYKDGINNSRVQIIYSINELSHRELYLLRILDEYFGVGVNSVLYNELRTKRGLVYDVLTYISYEKHIGLYKICFSTSANNVKKSIEIIQNSINALDEISEDKIRLLSKRMELKKLFKAEQGIVLAKELTTDSVMNKNFSIYEGVSGQEIIGVARKVFKSCAIEVINSKE